MKRFLNISAAVLLAAAVLVSCEPGPSGLFALLEQEKPLNKGTPALNANTAAFVTRLDTYYYAGVGSTLLRRLTTGGEWETVTDAGAPADSIITAGVSDGTNFLYVSYSPSEAADATKRIRRTADGAAWSDYASSGIPVLDGPLADKSVQVQNLLLANGQLFAVAQYSTGTSSADYETFFSIYSDGVAGNFSPVLEDLECGLPSSIAYDTVGSDYWIVAGNNVLTDASGSWAADSANATAAGFSSTNPVLGVFFDDTLGTKAIIAAATGKVWKLNTGGAYVASGTFGSAERRLSSVVVVPKNGGGNATVVGVKSWASDKYKGYYEYDAALNGTFGSGVVPSSAYDMVSDNSNYVTTLDDLSIEGFYYDDTSGEETLFARTVGGGLWSNTWNGTAWSGWDRE